MDLNDTKRKIAELEAKGDIPKAIAELEKAITSFPNDGSLFNKLGDLYLKMNKNKEAMDAYEKGVIVFRDETYFPNAIALCKKILRIDKERTEIYRYLGELHKELDQKGEAATYFLEYADQMIKQNKLETALEIYTKIKELTPNNPRIVTRIAEIHKLLKHDNEAAVLYKEAAEIYKDQGKLKEAKEIEKEVVKPAPKVEIKPKPKIDIAETEKVSLETLVSPEIAKLLEAEVSEEKKTEVEKETVEPTATAETEVETPVVTTEEEEKKEEKVGVEEEKKTPVEEPISKLSDQEPVSAVIEEKAEVKEVVEEAKEEVKAEATITSEEKKIEEKTEETKVEAPVQAEREEVVEQVQTIDGMLELANLYRNLGNMDEAYECYRMASEEAFNNKDWDKALMVFKKIVEFRPFDLRSRQKMIEIARYTKNKELEIESTLELADTLLRREAKSQAISLYKKVLTLDPDNNQAKEKLAMYEEPAKEEYIDLGAILKAEVEEETTTPTSLQNIRDLLSEFRKEVFESIGEGDYHSHYDLGVAYKGMGLYTEAIEEFHIAAKDRNLALKAFEMIGACLIEKDKIDDAITVMEAGLRIPDHKPVEYFGLYYLLAQAYESKGNVNKAVQLYTKAYSLDPSVKEVKVKIEGLKHQVAERKPVDVKEVKESETTQPKKSRITYL